MPDKLIVVHDVGQEYWYLNRHPCGCGGRFRMRSQMLQDRGEIPVDCLLCQCETCGSTREFLFDISPFEGTAAHREWARLSELVANEPDEELRLKVLSVAGSPAANAASTIMKLGASGDWLALDWLEDAIRHARGKRKV